jgi:predicted dehydrogenase
MVGCGGISHAHARAAQAIPNVSFTACCDVRMDVADEWAAAYGASSVYEDYAEMIGEENLDGVYLATWPNQHREQIERCIAAGARNILCEKSLTLTGQESMEIWGLVQESGIFLMEGFMYRHHPAIHKLESRIDSGEIGPVDYAHAVFNAFDAETASPTDPNRNWRQRKECGGGIPYDFACYCVNACQNLTGGIPVRVTCRGGRSSRYDTINRVFAIVEYDNGCMGILESSKKAGWNHEVQVACAHATLRLPVAWSIVDEIEISESRCEEWGHLLVDTYTVRKADAYQLQLENFAAVIREEAEPGMPLAETVVNVHTIEALVTSLEEDRAVDVTIPQAIRKTVLEDRAA